jgi:hypothetical protein
LEAVYCRSEKPKIGGPAEGGDGKATVPRMVHQEDARLETHGFIGKLAKCEGHPDLLESGTTQVLTPKYASPSATSAASIGTMSSLEESPQGELGDCLQHYGVKSVGDLRYFLDSLSPEMKVRMKESHEVTPSENSVNTVLRDGSYFVPRARKAPPAARKQVAAPASDTSKEDASPGVALVSFCWTMHVSLMALQLTSS